MKKQERITKILEQLDEHYSVQKKCWLDYDNAWQLLFATILSAQCTDARVNLVTKDLYVKYPNIEAFAKADLKELEQDIHSTGFYHNKAKNLIACSQDICQVDGINRRVSTTFLWSHIEQLMNLTNYNIVMAGRTWRWIAETNVGSKAVIFMISQASWWIRTWGGSPVNWG